MCTMVAAPGAPGVRISRMMLTSSRVGYPRPSFMAAPSVRDGDVPVVVGD